MKLTWTLGGLAALLLICSSCAHPPQPDSREVVKLEILGTKALKASAIEDKLVTAQSSWLPWWFPLLGHIDWFDETTWQTDLRRITRYYEANGYYQARIIEERIDNSKPKEVRLTVKVQEGEPAKVKSVHINGLDGVAEDVHQKLVDAFPVKVDQIFIEETWGTAKGELNKKLRELGYAESEVVGEALIDVQGAKVDITVEVRPGPRYHFGKLFAPTQPGARVPGSYLKNHVQSTLETTLPYSDEAMARAQKLVLDLGVFSAAKVTRGAPERGPYDPGSLLNDEFDEPTEKATRAYQHDKGLRETGIADEPTWRALLAEENAGATHIGPALRRGDGGPESLQRADVVRFKTLLASVNSRTPVVIDARESLFRTLRAGGGLSADLIRQEIRVSGEFVHRDIGLSRLLFKNALLDKLTLKGVFGWAFLPTIWNVIGGAPDTKHGPIFLAVGEYEVPRAFGISTLRFFGNVTGSRTLDNAFDYFSVESKVGFKWTPRPEVDITPSLHVNTYLLNVPASFGNTTALAISGCPTLPYACVVSKIEISAAYDKRDSLLEPKQGYLLALILGGGLAQTKTLNPFLKVLPEVRGYWTPGFAGGRFTFSGKVRVGSLFSTTTETPIVERFFSGGAMMRGFNQRRLSPMVAIPGRTVSNGKAVADYENGATLPIGGNGLFEVGLEVRFRFYEEWSLAMFNDWGLVTTPVLVGLEPKDFIASLYTAVGLGVRIPTPIGPVRFDIGVRIPTVGEPLPVRQDGATKAKYLSRTGCFGIGGTAVMSASSVKYAGSPEDSCNLHLSIGEAF